MFKVSQAASMLGISKQTLLRYEKKGIFPPSRRNRINSWRQYTCDDLAAMKQILGRGFTLIETVMVMVLAGIIAAIALPRINVLHSLRLSAACQKVLTDCRYVQQIAMSRHTNTSLTFDPGLNRYAAFEEYPSGSGDWQNLADPFSRAWLTVDFENNAQYKGVDIGTADFGGSGSLIFDRTGRTSVAGTVTLSLGGETKTCVVGSTGYAKIQ